MAKSRNSRVLYDIAARDNVAKDIWDLLPPAGQDWDIPDRGKRIERILKSDDVDRIYGMNDFYERNRVIRTVFSPTLFKAPPKKKAEMFVWIVHDWGRISAGFKGTRKWAYDLHDFTDKEVQRFIRKNDRYRVSSWSKILSFVDHENYAVYDSRTSVSLNVILEKLDLPYRFYMPGTRNTDLPLVIKHVRDTIDEVTSDNVRNRYRGYEDYIKLLKEIRAASGEDISILDVEMKLFKAAPDLAQEYIMKHNLIVPKPEPKPTNSSKPKKKKSVTKKQSKKD